MPVNGLTIPGYQQGPDANFAPLAQLPQLFQQGQARATLQNLPRKADGSIDTAPLYNSGDMNLAKLGADLDRQQQAQAQNAQELALRQQAQANTQQYQNKSLALQSRTQDRLEQTPEETAAERAKAAIAQGMKPTDPAFRQFVLTGKLPEQDTSYSTTIEQRKQAAIANGLDPSSPGFQSFVLTGKMPREDAQPLTSTDKKAILEADEAVSSNQAAIDSLKRAKDISPKAYSGFGAGLRGAVGSQAGLEGAKATEQLDNEITSNALGQLKAIFGGAPTEGERKILLDMQGSTSKPDDVRQGIYDRAIAAASKRLEFNRKRADEMRGGSYYKPKTESPKVGTVQDGYRFKGGDPAKPDSWVKVAP